MTSSTRSLLIVFALGMAIVAFGGFMLLTESDPAPPPATETAGPIPAPDFELELYSGKTIKLSDFKGKKPVVINFWASWCPPCREEAPELAKAGKEFAQDVEFIGITTNDTEEAAKAFMKEFGVTYVNGPDTTNIAASYKITGIPETFWIDIDGQIVDHWIGAIDEAGLWARTQSLIEK